MTAINTPLIESRLLAAYEETSADVKLEFRLIFRQTRVVEKWFDIMSYILKWPQ